MKTLLRVALFAAIALALFSSACSTSSTGPSDTQVAVDLQGPTDFVQPPIDTSIAQPDTSDALSGPDTLDPFQDLSAEAIQPVPDVIFDPTVDFPSEELHIAITAPSGSRWVAVSSEKVTLGGLVFGDVFNINYEHDKGDPGSAFGTPYWNTTDPILLKEGDNRITVTVKNATATATDAIVVTYNPGVRFQGNPRLDKQAVFVGTSQTICVNVQLDPFSKVEASTFRLLEVDKDGVEIKEVGKLIDNGSLSNCDEIQGDSVYSIKINPSTAAEKRYYYRAAVNYQFENTPKVARTAMFHLDVFEKIKADDLNKIKALQATAKDTYLSTLNAQGQQAAQTAALNILKADSLVDSVGVANNGFGIWVYYKSGIIGTVRLNPQGVRGSGIPTTAPLMSVGQFLSSGRQEVGTKRTIVLGAANKELGTNDEAADIHNKLKLSSCPTYSIDGPFYDSAVTVAKMRTLPQYGVIVFTGHGDALFKDLAQTVKDKFGWRHSGSQEVIWTGEKPGSSVSNELMIDLKQGRIAIDADGWAVLPSFIRDYSKGNNFPDSLVYLGACRSVYNGTMVAAFIGNGARTVFGYSQYVKNTWARLKGTALFTGLIDQKKMALQAFNGEGSDGGTPASKFLFFGNTSHSISGSEFTNGLFSKGNLNGWILDGDARVVFRLGKTGPISGKFMGIISTGLGFTTATGAMEQTFCIPDGASQISFWWKFYSEEFINDYCCSSFDDSLDVTLESLSSSLKKTLLKTSVNTICACGQGGPSSVAFKKSDVEFDVGDTWYVEWAKTTVDISDFAGKGPVKLRFFTTDLTDSAYDTAILIDKIEIR